MNFNYYIPTRIIFGQGRLKELATTPYLPGKKALIVISSGTSMKKLGYLDKVVECLKQNQVESVIFDKILPNPIEEHVIEGARIAKEQNCDFVIGLGGGSSIDSAKSIAIMAKNDGKYWDYIKGKTVKEVLPIVAIPTTAGTGTESDPWTVITNPETNEKVGYGIDGTYPVLSIVDPELMVSIPPQLTAFQGMDAFFHAVEGYLATCSQPSSDSYALSSIELINKYLPLAVEDGKNLEAREKLAWASTQSGMVESTSCCISQHSMEHALSGYHPDLPHGAGLVALSIPYFSKMLEKSIENNNKEVQNRYINMAKAMGENIEDFEENERPQLFIKALKNLIKNINLENLRLSDYNITKDEAEKFAINARDCMGFLFTLDPCQLSLEDTISIYEKTCEGNFILQ